MTSLDTNTKDVFSNLRYHLSITLPGLFVYVSSSVTVTTAVG